MKFFQALTICFIFCTLPSNAQILDKIKKVKNKVAEVTVDKLSRDPITTSFNDVDKTKYVENTFGDDANFRSIFEQPFTPENGYTLQPGFYEGTFQSFCIKAGTYNPIKGTGRFYAPIKGPKADILKVIIEGYQKNPDLTQREVQLLLWAIIAKTDFQKMNGPVKQTALKLLTPSQIARLSKGALDKLTRKQLKNVANQSEAIRAVLEAENNLRQKYYQGVRSYQDYENIAMRAGVEPIVPGFEAGRWTKHPDGYFLRYFPNGYARTTTQIYIPENMGTTSFNPSSDVAVPASSGQRLLQTNLPSGNPGSNTGGYVRPYEDPFCQTIIDPVADASITKQMIMQNIPGLAVAIFKNGKMIHLKAYGYNDYFTKNKITLNTKMKWASISKSITGVAAAQLEERGIGNFSVKDTVTDYVNNWRAVDFTDIKEEISGVDDRMLDITIDQLLSNSSGVQQYGKGLRDSTSTRIIVDQDTAVVKFIEKPSNYRTNARGFNAEKAVSVFNESVIDFTPGMNYLYSSYGFVLAGAAVDKVAPNGYRDWVENNIIRKASLRSLGVGNTKRPGHKIPTDGILQMVPSGFDEYTIPAGGYESNICDLAKYAQALISGIFFEDKKDILWNNSVSYKKSSLSDTKYSYGLNFDDIGPADQMRVWHGGHGGNVRSLMHFFPGDTTGIAIIAPAIYADLPHMIARIYTDLGIRSGSSSLYNAKHVPLNRCREKSMKSGGDLFHGVWRKTKDTVILRTGFEKSIFKDEIQFLKSNGYELVDVETFKKGGKRYWDFIVKKNIPDTKFINDITLSELKPKLNEMKDQGYIVKDIESYVAGNSGRLWGAVFSKEQKENITTFKRRTQEIQLDYLTKSNQGLKMIDVEAYRVGNVIHFNGIWESGSGSVLEVNVKPIDFYTKLNDRRNNGFRVQDIEYYMLSNQEWRIAVVWQRDTDDGYVTGEVPEEGEYTYFLPFCDMMDEHQNKQGETFELIDFERIDIERLE